MENNEEKPSPRSSPKEPKNTPNELSVIEFQYEIGRVYFEIQKNKYKNVILQFPNLMLKDSVPIVRILNSKLRAASLHCTLSILADK